MSLLIFLSQDLFQSVERLTFVILLCNNLENLMRTCCGYLVVLCCVIRSSKANGLVLLWMLDCLGCCLICSSCKLETLNYVYWSKINLSLYIRKSSDYWWIGWYTSCITMLTCLIIGKWAHDSSPLPSWFPLEWRNLSRGDSSFEVSNQSHLCRRSEASESLQASTRCISPNPTFTLGTTTTQATPKFRASRWSSVGCWKTLAAAPLGSITDMIRQLVIC